MEAALTPTIDYAAALRRRLPLGFLIGFLLLVLALAVALGLPAKYKSSATILIEQQDIPQDLVRSLVTSYADQRIQIISQRVLTSSNLTKIIDKFDLYADERKADPIEVVLDEMRSDIAVQPISADVVDQRSGRPTKATIAFELAFESSSPLMAQRVTSDLVSLFLSENLKERTEAAEDTLGFLTSESQRLRKSVDDLETELALFKEQHADALPNLLDLNLQLLNRSEQELVQLENQIRSLEQQRVYLESELSQQEPNTAVTLSETGQRIFGPVDRLKSLESQFISLKARYGPQHPDVVATQKEIASLRKETGVPPPLSELEARLQSLRAELAVKGEKYGDDHPDMRRLTKEAVALEEEIDASREVDAAERDVRSQAAPDNPVYVELQARLAANQADLQSLRDQRRATKARVADYESRLTAAPQVERQYSALAREYEIAQAEYREVQAKRQEAVLARSLEEDQKGERFNLIEPPIVPEQPDSPNRLAIVLLGLVVSVAGGVGAGALAETLDERVYGRNGLARITGFPPLAVIPVLENAALRSQKRRRIFIYAGALVIGVMLLALAIHIFVSPLDVLFYRTLRVIGN